MTKHNKHQKQNGNPCSQVVTPYEDEEDHENSTEIIPRQIPMPTQLKKPQSTIVTATSLPNNSNRRNCNDDDQSVNKPILMVNSNIMKNKRNADIESIEPPSMSISSNNKGRGNDGVTTRNSPFTIQHTHASEETRNYLTPSQITTPSRSCSNASSTMLSIKTKLFDNSNIHYLINDNNNFVKRIRTLLQTLTSMDLIPDQPMEWNRDKISSTVLDDDEPHGHFLSLLFSMIEVVCSDQNDRNNKEIKSKATRMQLHGLLTIMENIVNLLLRSNQDVDYWKDQCARRNQISNDEITGIHFQEQQNSNQCVQSSQLISLLQRENDTLRRQLMEIDATQLMELQTQLTDKLMECQRLQEMLHSTEQERNHLMHLWKEKESTNTNIEKESRSLKSENETLLDENSQLHAEVIRLRLSIHHDYEKRLKVSEENVQSLNIARNEILAQWNTAIKERTRLEGELGQCSRENSMIRQQLNYNQEEKTRLIRKIESLENLEQSRNIEIANSNREIKRTLVELDILNQTVRKLQDENNHLVNELNAIKMSSDMNSQKSFELERNAAKTQYDAETFRNMASELEMEKDAMAASLEAERKKTKKLEHIIQSIETKENAASENIRKLVREKALLQTKLNEAHVLNIKIRNKRINCSSLYETPSKSVACQSSPSNKLASLSTMSISKKEHHVHQDNTSSHESEQKIQSSSVIIENRRTDDVHQCTSCDKRSTLEKEQDKENIEPCKNVEEIPNPSLNQSKVTKMDEKTSYNDASNKNLSLLDYLSQDTVSTIM